MKTVKTDCCGDQHEYLIGNHFGDGRVRVEGTCPTCGAVDPRGTLIPSAREEG